MSVLSLSYSEDDVTYNKHLSELAPHHGGKKSWHGYGMKKLRHCHPMYTNFIRHCPVRLIVHFQSTQLVSLFHLNLRLNAQKSPAPDRFRMIEATSTTFITLSGVIVASSGKTRRTVLSNSCQITRQMPAADAAAAAAADAITLIQRN